jgi:hypothetical protein
MLWVGAHVAFGTHVQRLGLTVHFHAIQNHVQSNSELKVYVNFKNFGPKGMYPEIVLSQGLVYGWYNNTETVSAFIGAASNQTNYRYAMAYTYNFYFNRIKTSQQTGIIALYIGRWQLLSENDLLARPSLDRFRTAAIMLQYRYQNNYLMGMHCTLWTGQFGHKHSTENTHFKNRCYMDTAGGKYTQRSHGILALQLNSVNYLGQNLQVNAGIDAEQVRQAVQNNFIHDMPFLPAALKKQKNCHIPMVDSGGNPYFFEPTQKIRKPKLFLNTYTNAPLFY